MVDITLFELHLDGSEFTANAPNSGVLDNDGDGDDESGGPPLGLFAVLALVVLVVAAGVAKKVGGSDEAATIDE